MYNLEKGAKLLDAAPGQDDDSYGFTHPPLHYNSSSSKYSITKAVFVWYVCSVLTRGQHQCNFQNAAHVVEPRPVTQQHTEVLGVYRDD